MSALLPRPAAQLGPGAVHVPAWLSQDERRDLVVACRSWARPPAGMRTTRLPTGGMMSVRTVCLGWHWYPYAYSRTVAEGEPVKPFPDWLGDLARRALADAYGGTVDGDWAVDGHDWADGGMAAARQFAPDVAVVNFYDANAKMGMHRDREERSPAPVVSLSLGDTGVFRLGNVRGRGRPWQDVQLESGDLLVFGGPARFVYHGVTKILPGTGEPGIGLPAGRLNITIRETGLTSLRGHNPTSSTS